MDDSIANEARRITRVVIGRVREVDITAAKDVLEPFITLAYTVDLERWINSLCLHISACYVLRESRVKCLGAGDIGEEGAV